ncbi:hypothetical protein [Arthrobacter woluwensis]|uniref:hypothetical protein n=1 Tax=Arthrobacter woluwensis TaxID=156980 RepID=UPI0027D920A5|nr:hypothetical protein [Arthrobacter woluwensis]
MSANDTGAEARGRAARQMIAEDARWAMDLVLSAQSMPDLNPYIALLLGHHFVRIVYEGSAALRSRNSHVGIPQLANLLGSTFASVTERGRHITKMLDDKRKSYDTILGELDQVITEHRSTFTGNAGPWTRWLESDIGLYMADGRLLGASWPTAYRLGLSVETDGTIAGHDLQAVTQEWGGMLAVLGAAGLNPAESTATLDLTGVPAIRGMDKRSDRYLRQRFEGDFPDALKMLLLGIEGDMNTLAIVASHSEPGHEFAVFRARTITLYHSLTALVRIAKHYDSANSKSLPLLRELLADSAVRAILSSHGKMVRNRCMHYEINDPRVIVNPNLPMFGIVEAVFPGETWAGFNAKVRLVMERVAILLSTWSVPRHQWHR